MKYFLFALPLVMLLSCGEAPRNNALTQDVGASGTLLVTVHHLGQTVPNMTVSLDTTGDIYTKTDNSGTATFSGVKSGNHDIHVFTNESTGTWVSMYAVSGSQVYVDITRYAASAVTLSGSASNINANSRHITTLFKDSVSTSFVGNSPILNGNYAGKINVGNMNNAMTLSGDMFFLEEQDIGNDMFVVDGLTVLGQSLTTGNAFARNLTFSATKPSPSVMLTLEGFTAPVAMNVASLAVQYAPPVYGQTADLMRLSNPSTPNVNAPLALSTYDSADLATDFTYIRLQDAAINPLWKLVEKVSKYGTTSLATRFTALASIVSSKSGAIDIHIASAISTIAGGYTVNRIYIAAVGGSQVLWELNVPPETTHVQLPTLPAHIAPVLTAGALYDVVLQAEMMGNYTYQQMLAEDFSRLTEKPTPWEWVKTPATTYTH